MSQGKTTGEALNAGTRLKEVDLARGLVMVLMALDHARDYVHKDAFRFDPLDPDRTFALLYATRWITHLCAPTFVFLAGVSAFLQAAKGKTGLALSGFLLSRGVWLVALEVTVISFGWEFAAPWMLFLQVIWAIGVSMIVLSALVLLPQTAVLALGATIILGHNLLDPLTAEQMGPIWVALHDGGPIVIGGKPVGFIAYPVLPWIGVMAFGYGVGPLFLRADAHRHRTLLAAGIVMLLAFAILRGSNVYGNPTPRVDMPTFGQDVMAFLNVQKYPPSLDYVLATLGVMALALPLLARLKGAPAQALTVFGAVPFFFYVLHIYLTHGLAILANALAGQDPSPLLGALQKSTSPDGITSIGFPLFGAYVLWVVVVALLYFPCRYWADLKRRRRDWWLSYL